MKFPHPLQIVAGFALIALPLLAIPAATAQTIISNETLMTTTFVVNTKSATAQCGNFFCNVKTPMFATIPVICPAATGQTCTFHISLDTKISENSGATSFYQFLVDGAPPTIGPTFKNGVYIVEGSYANLGAAPLVQSAPASVLTTVTNSNSNNHTIVVNLGCFDGDTQGGCQTTAHASTMRVDVFEP
jgi:hypothetical protein